MFITEIIILSDFSTFQKQSTLLNYPSVIQLYKIVLSFHNIN